MASYVKTLKDNRGNIIIPRTTAKVSTYDNTASQLDATNTQDAIDELADGRIKTVAGVSPDENGNVPLTAANIGATPLVDTRSEAYTFLSSLPGNATQGGIRFGVPYRELTIPESGFGIYRGDIFPALFSGCNQHFLEAGVFTDSDNANPKFPFIFTFENPNSPVPVLYLSSDGKKVYPKGTKLDMIKQKFLTDTNSLVTYTNFPFAEGYGSLGGVNCYWKDAIGQVHLLLGFFGKADADFELKVFETVGTLPEGFRPKANFYISLTDSFDKVNTASIQNTGAILVRRNAVENEARKMGGLYVCFPST